MKYSPDGKYLAVGGIDKDTDGFMHCIYVVSEDYDYGILIESEGSDYPRYTAYLPKAIFDLK